MRGTTERVLLASILLLVAGLVGGCADSGADQEHATSPTSGPDNGGTGPPAVNAPGLQKGVEAATDVPTDVPNDPDLRNQVALEACTATDRGWAATGTATNPDSDARSYTVTVFFTTAHATVLGSASTKVTTAPAATQPWRVTDRFKAPKGTRCVLRGVG